MQSADLNEDTLSKVTCKTPLNPWINCRMVLALVSMTHSITALPGKFMTAIEMLSLLCRARHYKEHADFRIMLGTRTEDSRGYNCRQSCLSLRAQNLVPTKSARFWVLGAWAKFIGDVIYGWIAPWPLKYCPRSFLATRYAIEQVGTGVSEFHVGDKVIISCVTACLKCDFCKRMDVLPARRLDFGLHHRWHSGRVRTHPPSRRESLPLPGWRR